MRKDELAELLEDCPTLYHMAESGSWPSIRDRGLYSTSGLLDLYEIRGAERQQIETQRRPSSVPLTHSSLPVAVVRDQIPMDDAGLLRALPKHIKPSDWYQLLNKKVFFWLTKSRLQRLLNAGAYREKSHDVLEIKAQALIEAYHDKIWLCPINSGSTKPFPHPRDEKTFMRIVDYPYADWRKKRAKGERAVELAVDYAVSDVIKFVTKVSRMRGEEELEVIYSG